MLIQFKVANFRSFRDETTLSLVASSDKSLPENVIRNAQDSGIDLLKSAVVYGANASGKSNLINSLDFMMAGIRSSFETNPDRINKNPFALDESKINEPSFFEIEFLTEKVRYRYGFEITDKEVVSEWYYSYPEKRPRLLFRRDGNHKPYWGPHWKGESQRLFKLTRPNALFISVGAQFNQPQCTIVANWARKKIKYASDWPLVQEQEFTTRLCRNKSEEKNKILAMLKLADLGIADIKIESHKIDDSAKMKRLPKEVRGKVFELLKNKQDMVVDEVYILHSGIDRHKNIINVKFDLEEESHGTQKFFALAGPLYYVLSRGCCLLADELEVKLHPILTKAIINSFHNPKINYRESQLVCTTHDVNLLDDKALFRRDQIWLMEKDEFGASRLSSLWDYRPPRKEENLRKGYLAGRYGAVPFIEKLVDWEQGETEPQNGQA